MNDAPWLPAAAIAAEIRACWRGETRSYHMPGHKGGRGTHPLALELIGATAWRADLSELSGFDYLHAASGRIAAEFVIPYPPGIPLQVPGEIIDDTSLRQIGALRGAGCDMVGPADRALNTLRVLHN